jgi:hypothetical protein
MTDFLAARAPEWSEAQIRELLAACLDKPTDSSLVDSWDRRLNVRRGQKEAC